MWISFYEDIVSRSVTFLHWRRKTGCTVCPKQCIKDVFNLYLSFCFHYYCGKLWYIQTCNHCVAVCWVYILCFQVLEIKCRKNTNQRKIFRKPERLKGDRSCGVCLSLTLWGSTEVRNEKECISKAPCVWACTAMQYGHYSDGLIVALEDLRILF